MASSSSSGTSTARTGDQPPSERVLLKIIVLGAANVGKSSVLRRYTAEKFSETRRPTIGADFSTKKIRVEDTEVVIQIWDTAGQERFHQGVAHKTRVHAHSLTHTYTCVHQ